MWKSYEVKLEMQGQFAASMPKTPEEIESMLTHRMPNKPPKDAVSIDELIETVIEEVGAEPEYGWATFKKDNKGLYYEGRCIRGHIKDCAQQVANMFDIKAFKAKVANKVYVETDRIYLGKNEPDGFEQRFIQVMTRQGPRSTYKFIDYVQKPTLVFRLKILEDGVISAEILDTIFDYGSVHGLGQERSQGWGRYTYTITEIK